MVSYSLEFREFATREAVATVKEKYRELGGQAPNQMGRSREVWHWGTKKETVGFGGIRRSKALGLELRLGYVKPGHSLQHRNGFADCSAAALARK